MNGENGVIKTIEQPLHLLKKLPNNKFLAFSERKKVFEIDCNQYKEVQFKLALNEKNWDKVKETLQALVGSEKKILIKYLVEKGYASKALDLVNKPE